MELKVSGRADLPISPALPLQVEPMDTTTTSKGHSDVSDSEPLRMKCNGITISTGLQCGRNKLAKTWEDVAQGYLCHQHSDQNNGVRRESTRPSEMQLPGSYPLMGDMSDELAVEMTIKSDSEEVSLAQGSVHSASEEKFYPEDEDPQADLNDLKIKEHSETSANTIIESKSTPGASSWFVNVSLGETMNRAMNKWRRFSNSYH